MPSFHDKDKTFLGLEPKDKPVHLVDLPSIPVLMMEALQCTASNPNLSHLADKIAQDPPMVARILRIANSPFYGMSREISTLREAIVLLGLNRVRDMLLSVCFLKLMPVPHKDFDYPLLWHHSLAVADCARQLGMYTGIAQDIAFTAGLLHDIGILVIVLQFPDEYCRVIKGAHPDRVATERRIFGFDHVEIGSKVVRHWNLPLAIQEAIEQHETPPAPGAAMSLGLLIYTANLLIKEAEQGSASDAEYRAAILNAIELLDIPIERAVQWADASQQFADQILATL